MLENDRKFIINLLDDDNLNDNNSQIIVGPAFPNKIIINTSGISTINNDKILYLQVRYNGIIMNNPMLNDGFLNGVRLDFLSEVGYYDEFNIGLESTFIHYTGNESNFLQRVFKLNNYIIIGELLEDIAVKGYYDLNDKTNDGEPNYNSLEEVLTAYKENPNLVLGTTYLIKFKITEVQNNFKDWTFTIN